MGWPDDCVLVETLVRCNLALLYSRYGEHKTQAQRTATNDKDEPDPGQWMIYSDVLQLCSRAEDRGR